MINENFKVSRAKIFWFDRFDEWFLENTEVLKHRLDILKFILIRSTKSSVKSSDMLSMYSSQ